MTTKNNLESGIFQVIIWVIILVLIVVRIIGYNVAENDWIWFVNYAGMAIALINMLLNKCFQLRGNRNKKYKPFVGFTIFMAIIVCIIGFWVYSLQSTKYYYCVNDVITLLALFFSLSYNVWDYILNGIVHILKR